MHPAMIDPTGCGLRGSPAGWCAQVERATGFVKGTARMGHAGGSDAAMRRAMPRGTKGPQESASPMTDSGASEGRPAASGDARKARLAAALRANLRRRKAQRRAREAPAETDVAQAPAEGEQNPGTG
jgi:hypothetical protein